MTINDTGHESICGDSPLVGAESASGAWEDDIVARVRALEQDNIVQNHMLLAMGVGMIPVPGFDFFGVTSVQISMLRGISRVYEIPFSKSGAQSILLSLVGGAVPAYTALPIARFLQSMPFVGWTLSAGSMSLLSGASTYAVGKVFAHHCEQGGTLCNFDAEAARERFSRLFSRGRDIASEQSASAAQTVEG